MMAFAATENGGLTMRMIELEAKSNLLYVSEMAFEQMQRIPAVDAEPVVRCKDCKKNPDFQKTSGKHMVWCRQWRCEVRDTGYCSYGERRADDGQSPVR